MPGIILTHTHKTAANVTYTVRIYDKEATENSANTMTLEGNTFEITHEGDENDIYTKIIPTNATIRILTGFADNTNVQNFYNELTESPEGRFFLEIKTASHILFRGKIIVDVGDFLVTKFGDFTITAICGLKELKNISYRPVGYSDTTPELNIKATKFKDHFFDILSRNQVVQFFKELAHDASTVFPLFSTSASWECEFEVITGDIFASVKVRNYWYEQKTPTYRIYENCYDVLEDLLQGFLCRIYFENGIFMIEQISYMDNPTPTIYRYDIDTDNNLIAGTGITKRQLNYTTNTNMFARDGVLKRRLAPLKYVKLEQAKGFFNYWSGLLVRFDGLVSGGYGTSGPHNFGYIIGTGSKMIHQWYVDITTGNDLPVISPGFSGTIEFICTFKVTMGDYFLIADNPAYFNNILDVQPRTNYHLARDGEIPKLSWTLDDSEVTIRWINTINPTTSLSWSEQLTGYKNLIKNSPLIIETNEIQTDDEIVYEFLDFVVKLNDDIESPSSFMEIRTNSRLIVGNSYNDLLEQPKGIDLFEVGDVNNTESYDFELGYYDSEKDTVSRLFIHVPFLPDYFGAFTSEWTDPDSALTLPIQHLMMKTALSMRSLPVKLYQMTFFFKNNTVLKMGDQIIVNDVIYIILKLKIIGNISGYTHFDCTIWEVYKDYTGINIIDTGTPDTPDQPILTAGSLDYGRNNNNISGVQYFEEWENVTLSYVTVTGLAGLVNVNDSYQTKTKNHFIINGVRQKYTPSGTLKIREFRFDVPNERILFVKGSGPVAHIEFITYY